MTLEQLIEAMTGRWTGEESIMMDPAAGQTLSATGQFETSPILAGAGTRSSYVQTISGDTGLRCETIYRFGPDEAVTMIWVPSEGEAQTFNGQRDGAVLTVSRQDETGMTQVQTADYSTSGKMTSRMAMVMPDGAEMTVFEGLYDCQHVAHPQPKWHDLTVPEPNKSLAFYEGVFGGKPVPVSMGDYDDYNLTDAAGQTVGGLCHARGGNAKLPPVWLSYFPVPSLDAAIAAAKGNGGNLLSGPHTAGTMRYAVISDPSGAAFALSEG